MKTSRVTEKKKEKSQCYSCTVCSEVAVRMNESEYLTLMIPLLLEKFTGPIFFQYSVMLEFFFGGVCA